MLNTKIIHSAFQRFLISVHINVLVEVRSNPQSHMEISLVFNYVHANLSRCHQMIIIKKMSIIWCLNGLMHGTILSS